MVEKSYVDDAETVVNYPSDVRIERFHDSRLDEPRYRVVAFDLVEEFPDESPAKLFADVWWAVDGFREEHTGKRGIPPAVATDSAPARVAYCCAIPNLGPDWARHQFGLDQQTVQQYVSRVRKRSEEARDEFLEQHDGYSDPSD